MAMNHVDTDRLDAIAEEFGLSGHTGELFREYVAERFPDALDIYLREWAGRFAAGLAHAASDPDGKAILGHIAREHGIDPTTL